MKGNPLKAVNIMTFLLSLTVLVISLVGTIGKIGMPGWIWAVLLLSFSMCVVAMTMDRIFARIKYLEETLQITKTDKEVS